MNIKVNDEIILKKDCFLGNKGDVFVVKKIFDGKATLYKRVSEYLVAIEFTFTIDKAFDNYFDKVTKEDEETQENDWIEVILDNSEIVTTDAFDTCHVVAVKLPNGYVIVDSFNCIDESDEEYCYDAIMEKIYNKIYELEDYAAMYPSNLAVLNEDYCPYADDCQES